MSRIKSVFVMFVLVLGLIGVATAQTHPKPPMPAGHKSAAKKVVKSSHKAKAVVATHRGKSQKHPAHHTQHKHVKARVARKSGGSTHHAKKHGGTAMLHKGVAHKPVLMRKHTQPVSKAGKAHKSSKQVQRK